MHVECAGALGQPRVYAMQPGVLSSGAPKVLAGPQITLIPPWPAEHTWVPPWGSEDTSFVKREGWGHCPLCEVSCDFSFFLFF